MFRYVSPPTAIAAENPETYFRKMKQKQAAAGGKRPATTLLCRFGRLC